MKTIEKEKRKTYPLDNKLSNAISSLHGEIDLGVVEQENLHLTTVIGVNDSSASVDEVLRGEAAAGRDAAVYMGIMR